MGEWIDKLVENLEKAGLGHKISRSEIKLRNCRDVPNFLKRKEAYDRWCKEHPSKIEYKSGYQNTLAYN